MKVKAKSHWDPSKAPTFWINHASRLLMRHFEQRLRPLDFGMAYLPVVVALNEHGTLQQKLLAKLAHVEQPTMAALLTRMDRDGLITRKPHPSDKRSTEISLSAKARTRLPAAQDQLVQVANQATAGLTEKEQATFVALLQRVVANLS